MKVFTISLASMTFHLDFWSLLSFHPLKMYSKVPTMLGTIPDADDIVMNKIQKSLHWHSC